MNLLELLGLGRLGRQLAGERALGLLQLVEQLGCDGQEVAARQFGDLADIAEARAHDLGAIVKLLEVIIDLNHRVHAGIVGGRDALDAAILEIPVVDPADEWRDEGDAGLGTRHGLGKAKEQRQVAVDPFFFEPLGRGSLPRSRRP